MFNNGQKRPSAGRIHHGFLSEMCNSNTQTDQILLFSYPLYSGRIRFRRFTEHEFYLSTVSSRSAGTGDTHHHTPVQFQKGQEDLFFKQPVLIEHKKGHQYKAEIKTLFNPVFKASVYILSCDHLCPTLHSRQGKKYSK